MKKNKGLGNVPIILGIMVLSLLIPATVKLVQQSQETRRAAEDLPTCWALCEEIYKDSCTEITKHCGVGGICNAPADGCSHDRGGGLGIDETVCDKRTQIGTFIGSEVNDCEGTCRCYTSIETHCPEDQICDIDPSTSCDSCLPVNTPTQPAPTTPADTPTPTNSPTPTPCSCTNPNRPPGTRICDGRNHILKCDRSSTNICSWSDIQTCLYGCSLGNCLSPTPTTPSPIPPTFTPTTDPTPVPPTNTPQNTPTPIPALSCTSLSLSPSSGPYYEDTQITLECSGANATRFEFKTSIMGTNSTLASISSTSGSASFDFKLIVGDYYFQCRACNQGSCSNWEN